MSLYLALPLSINLCYFILSALAPYILLPLPLFIYFLYPLNLPLSLFLFHYCSLFESLSPSLSLSSFSFVHLHTHKHTSNDFILEIIIFTSLRLAGRELVNTIAWFTSVQKKYE